MIFERIKAEGIAHNSYLIGSGRDAAVIDPKRDCQIYIDSAQQKRLKIKYIFETHRNEDYVVGSIELNNITGAEIYHGPGLDCSHQPKSLNLQSVLISVVCQGPLSLPSDSFRRQKTYGNQRRC